MFWVNVVPETLSEAGAVAPYTAPPIWATFESNVELATVSPAWLVWTVPPVEARLDETDSVVSVTSPLCRYSADPDPALFQVKAASSIVEVAVDSAYRPPPSDEATLYDTFPKAPLMVSARSPPRKRPPPFEVAMLETSVTSTNDVVALPSPSTRSPPPDVAVDWRIVRALAEMADEPRALIYTPPPSPAADPTETRTLFKFSVSAEVESAKIPPPLPPLRA